MVAGHALDQYSSGGMSIGQVHVPQPFLSVSGVGKWLSKIRDSVTESLIDLPTGGYAPLNAAVAKK